MNRDLLVDEQHARGLTAAPRRDGRPRRDGVLAGRRIRGISRRRPA